MAPPHGIGSTLLDIVVEITGFDLEGDERRGLVARCQHQGTKGTISLADVRFEADTIAGLEWFGIST
jgi:hypothetical protein